jgi:FtsP/CotA-like multicopper oxidase with cupredoxin domain
MSAANTNRSVTRVFLPAVVLGVLFSMLLSGSALAMRVYEGPSARQANARKHLKASSHRTHRRVRARASAALGFNLCAEPGTVTPAGAVSPIPIWGFAIGACSSVTVGIPAPNLSVNEGDTVTLNIENTLDDEIKIEIPGITLNPGSHKIAAGTSGSVSFTASNPGTFLYQSDGDAGRQSVVGLAGALIVRPLTAGRAYDDASTAYNTEAVMVLSEIDPALNAATLTPGALASFDMTTYAPKYRLINGLAYPATGTIPATSNSKVILRYVNAGTEHASMTLLGADATVVGRDGSFLTTPLGVTADTVPSGGTSDEIVQIPAGSAGKKFAIYDRNLALVNGSAAGLGGRVRFIQVP